MEPSGFWIEEEPYELSDFVEDADRLNGPRGERLLPMTFEVNTPWGTVEELTIHAVEREHMEEGDFRAQCTLGESQRSLVIEWNQAAGTATVGNNTSLDEVLDGFARQRDVLPPVRREVDETEIYEFSGLEFSVARNLSAMLHADDPDEELIYLVVVYGERAVESLRQHLAKGYSEFLGHDANGEELVKFVLPLENSVEFHNLMGDLTGVNATTELTFDVVVLWNLSASDLTRLAAS